MARVSENDVALAILRIAAARPDNLCTFHRARNEVPNHLTLSADDLAVSVTRPNEPLWHQLIRNVRSHHDTEGNFIYEGFLEHVPRRGYLATEAGEKHLK